MAQLFRQFTRLSLPYPPLPDAVGARSMRRRRDRPHAGAEKVKASQQHAGNGSAPSRLVARLTDANENHRPRHIR